MPSASRVLGAVALILTIAAPAGAQGFGLGPRFSFVRGTVDAESSARYVGGLVRLRMSPRTAIEVSLDYRSVVSEDLRQRVKDFPVQGSLLAYLTRTTLAPYLLGGIGWYSQRVEQITPDGSPIAPSVTTRKVGYHAGLGGEVDLGTHASIHADYRYTFINFGDQDESAPGALPIPGSVGLQEKLKLSHRGSMWTTGVTFYF
jgi:hypothetical protein